MSVKAITEEIHDYMYEKLNELLETEEEKKNRHVKKKVKYDKEQTERYPKASRLDCNSSTQWSNSMSVPQERKRRKMWKTGHYAKYCRSTRIINHIAHEDT